MKTTVGDFGEVDAPILPIILLMTGGYLMWFGVHYWRRNVKWPSDPIKSVLQGKGIPAPGPLPSYSASITGSEAAPNHSGPASGNVTGGSPQNMAKLLLSKYGWSASQMTYLVKLWDQESGWNPKARNPTSGAYGIAQALGHGGSNTNSGTTNEYGAQYGLTARQAQEANAGNPLQQIRWGLGYIKARYGSPQAAWQHEVSAGWY